jgi:hypothetical protein
MKYIGAHTGQEDDGYIGGGKKFRDDLRKFGLINFERKILEYIEDASKIKDRENYYLDLLDAANSSEYYNTARRSSGLRTKTVAKQTKRSLCCVCHQRPVAVNYVKDDIKHYRTKCDACLKKKKNPKPFVPKWQASGYKKKMTCDRCGFRAKHVAQIMVYHIDGNLNNAAAKNLKSVCRNCEVELTKTDLPWRRGDLEPDL